MSRTREFREELARAVDAETRVESVRYVLDDGRHELVTRGAEEDLDASTFPAHEVRWLIERVEQLETDIAKYEADMALTCDAPPMQRRYPGEPEVGSVWVSRDHRDDGRKVRVLSLETGPDGTRYARVGQRGSELGSRVRLPLTRLYRLLDGTR